MHSYSKSEPSLHLYQFRLSGMTQGVSRHKQNKRSSPIPSTEAFADQESYSPVQILVKTKKSFLNLKRYFHFCCQVSIIFELQWVRECQKQVTKQCILKEMSGTVSLSFLHYSCPVFVHLSYMLKSIKNEIWQTPFWVCAKINDREGRFSWMILLNNWCVHWDSCFENFILRILSIKESQYRMKSLTQKYGFRMGLVFSLFLSSHDLCITRCIKISSDLEDLKLYVGWN